MNEELQKAIALLMDKTIQGVGTSLDFLSDEIPDYIQQLLLWYGVKSALLFLLGVVMLVLIIKLERFTYLLLVEHHTDTRYEEVKVDMKEVYFMYLFPFSIIRLPLYMFNGSLLCNTDWLYIYVAPKVWLVEYAMNLAK